MSFSSKTLLILRCTSNWFAVGNIVLFVSAFIIEPLEFLFQMVFNGFGSGAMLTMTSCWANNGINSEAKQLVFSKVFGEIRQRAFVEGSGMFCPGYASR